MTATQPTPREILIACGDIDLLKAMVQDLPANTFKPIATRRGQGVTKKLKGREISLAIVHAQLEDDYALNLLEELRQSAPSVPIMYLTIEPAPKHGSFDVAMRYPMPGPVFRHTIKRMIQPSNATQDLEKWRLFYRELKGKIQEIDRHNYFEALGLSEGAQHYEIVEAFDILSLRYHPDRYNQFRDEKWGQAIYEMTNQLYKLIAEAYTVLSDRRLRDRYEEALRKGELRLELSETLTSASAAPRSLVEIGHSSASKKFLRLAQVDIAKNDFSSALQNLQFAQSMEPNNTEIAKKITELQSTLTPS